MTQWRESALSLGEERMQSQKKTENKRKRFSKNRRKLFSFDLGYIIICYVTYGAALEIVMESDW